jgi:arsenate reductase
MIIYTYKGCSTCKAATKWLTERGISFDERPIRETPPSIAELNAMLKARRGELGKLFNTSGQDYRAMGLKDKLPTLGTAAALELLHQNGNLVKRPFLIDQKKEVFLTGFKQGEWELIVDHTAAG